MNINKININQTEPTYDIASEIYDVTANNNGTTFESLSELFSAENLYTLIPTAVRCGGMTIRFVKSSTKTYVQYRYMLKNATDNSVFTNRVNWNLVERESIIHILNSTTIPIEYFIKYHYYDKDRKTIGTHPNFHTTGLVRTINNLVIKDFGSTDNSNVPSLVIYDDKLNLIRVIGSVSDLTQDEIDNGVTVKETYYFCITNKGTDVVIDTPKNNHQLEFCPIDLLAQILALNVNYNGMLVQNISSSKDTQFLSSAAIANFFGGNVKLIFNGNYTLQQCIDSISDIADEFKKEGFQICVNNKTLNGEKDIYTYRPRYSGGFTNRLNWDIEDRYSRTFFVPNNDYLYKENFLKESYFDIIDVAIAHHPSLITTGLMYSRSNITVNNLGEQFGSASLLIIFNTDLTIYREIRKAEDLTEEDLTTGILIPKNHFFCISNTGTTDVHILDLDNSREPSQLKFLDISSPFLIKNIKKLVQNSIASALSSITPNDSFSYQLPSRLGSIRFEGFNSNGYSHLIVYGQSLSTGDNSWCPITGARVPAPSDCFMIGDDPTDTSGSINPLVSDVPQSDTYTHTNGAESPVAGAAVALSNALAHTPMKTKIIATSCGYGGQTITQLSKGTARYDRFLQALSSAKAGTQESIKCPAIVWMQGEYDQRTSDTITVAQYKQAIVQLKNDMQADIMSQYSQEKPLFFVYQPSYLFTPKYPVVAEAIRQASIENDDIILLNPHYYCPQCDSGHLTANGYRWYGEQIAKSILAAHINMKNSGGIRLLSTERDGKKIFLNLEIPTPPLKVDTQLAHAAYNNGFAVYVNDTSVSISDISVQPFGIILTLADEPSSSDTVEVEYAGQLTNGLGNIRDSDDYKSSMLFVDPTIVYDSQYNSTLTTSQMNNLINKDNEKGLVGKPYPGYNWLNTFRVTL